jgi:hypothetical protein
MRKDRCDEADVRNSQFCFGRKPKNSVCDSQRTKFVSDTRIHGKLCLST